MAGASAAETLRNHQGCVCNVVAIRSVQASGVDWYELELAGGVKRYVEKERLPVWEEFSPNTDLVKQVQARGKPTKEAEQVRVLAPDSLIPSRRYGAQSASVEKERWYWIAQADFPVFFSERDSVGALAQCTLVEGCLQANKSLRAPAPSWTDGIWTNSRTAIVRPTRQTAPFAGWSAHRPRHGGRSRPPRTAGAPCRSSADDVTARNSPAAAGPRDRPAAWSTLSAAAGCRGDRAADRNSPAPRSRSGRARRRSR